MQTRTLIYKNLYMEIKQILKNSNKTNNNKYDIEKIEQSEKEYIKLINDEITTEYNLKISLSQKFSKEENDKDKIEGKLELPKNNKSDKVLIEERSNKEFIDLMCDIIPHEIGKIEIKLVASGKNLTMFRFEYFTTFYTKKELLKLADYKKEFSYKNVKREIGVENKIEKDEENLIVDFSILSEKKNEKDFILYIDEILKEKETVILENKEILNEKQIKSSLIRYFLLSKKNYIIKIDINKEEIDKDIENNFYLPKQIYNYVEENQINNIININRIKNNFNFLKPESIGLNIKTSNSEKYFKEYLE